MKIRFAHALLLTLLAVIFTIGLTFASVELPRLADSFLQQTVSHPGGDSHANDLDVFKAELFIKHYHITEALNDDDWGVRFYADEALKAIRKGDK